MTYHHPAAVSLLLAASSSWSEAASQPRSVPGIPAPQLTDGVSGAKLDSNVLPLLSASKHIYVGETHDGRADHQVQLGVLKTHAAMGHQVVIGVEWLPTHFARSPVPVDGRAFEPKTSYNSQTGTRFGASI